MITIREATLDDVAGIRDVFQSEYGQHYAYPQYYDVHALHRLVYADGSILLVAIDDATQRVAGTASVVFGVGAYNDLVGEFGRLVVHPDFRGRGIGKLLMQGRIERVRSRLHVGLVENRTTHTFSQRISGRYGFVPVGLVPLKLLVERRESIALFVQYFGDALTLRRNNPRIIPEARQLAGLACDHVGLPQDAIVDDTSAAFPQLMDFELDELRTEGYASLLRIERGRLRHRDLFGPVRLHYGLFQLQARHSHYLLARRHQQIVGGIGFMFDEVEKAVRIFELITCNDEPIRFLLEALLQRCQNTLDVDYIEADVSAYSPRMQRTLLELGFFPDAYIPANVFHEVERLDAVKMSRLLVPFDGKSLQFSDIMRPIADVVMHHLQTQVVPPQLDNAWQQATLFQGLNQEQRRRLLAIAQPRTCSPGDFIMRRGVGAGSMYLILSGQVTLFAAHDRPLASVSPGQCIGETALLRPTHADTMHSVDAVAQTMTQIAEFPRSTLNELIRTRPDIGVALYRNLALDISDKLKQAESTLAP